MTDRAKGFMSGFALALLTVGVALFIACTNTADTREASQVQSQQEHYRQTQPPPYFEYSLERYLMIELYKARNEAVATWSYRYDDYLGRIIWECASIGFPIPGGTQLTNPQQWISGSNGAVIPQAEPNGMFSPDTSRGTYVMCLNDDGTVSPRYAEPDVETFPYPMIEQGGRLVPAKSPSLRIDPKKAMQTPSSSAPTPPATTPATPTLVGR